MNNPNRSAQSTPVDEHFLDDAENTGLVEVGKVSETKGGLLGGLADPGGNGWRQG